MEMRVHSCWREKHIETLSRKSWRQPHCATLCHNISQHVQSLAALVPKGPKVRRHSGSALCQHGSVRSVRAVDAMDKEFPIDEHRATKQLDCRSCRSESF